jgi:two-component system, OmpR family, sensor histidine kinase MtrB
MTVERTAAAIPLQASAAGWRQAVIRTVGRWVKRSGTAWRRSIMLRVVGATLALSVLIVFLLGQLVLGQVRDGLLRAKVKSAVAEASSGFTAANQRLIVAETSAESESTGDLVNDIVQDAANSGGGLYNVVLLSDASPGATTGAALASGGVKLETVTSLPDLVGKVGQSPQPAYAYRYAPILYDSGTAKGLIVGSRIRGYQVYYLFPLDQEQATLNLVRQRLATTGGLLVLLLGLIAYVLTRQVVSPVRMAARISARIAAGQLDERMQVSGEDDLARLASSFNRMATHLQQQIRQLEDLSRVQRRFVADVSHELRTPLTTVRMAADVLHEARDTFHPQVARSAELLQTQLDRFEALLSDLLEISRFDAGAAVLEAEPVDLRDIAAKVIEAAEPLAERRGAALRLVGPQVPCVAEVDPRRIERVLRNLVVNAIEHCDGRDVVVRVAANDEAVAVAVRDYGVGLKPGEASLVFNRFWRADPARARTTGGTGLGLSIALEDAHLHGGWLQAWGQPGAGSQFRLTVPRAVGQAIDRSPIPLEPADARRMHALAELSSLRAGVRGPHAPA